MSSQQRAKQIIATCNKKKLLWRLLDSTKLMFIFVMDIIKEQNSHRFLKIHVTDHDLRDRTANQIIIYLTQASLS